MHCSFCISWRTKIWNLWHSDFQAFSFQIQLKKNLTSNLSREKKRHLGARSPLTSRKINIFTLGEKHIFCFLPVKFSRFLLRQISKILYPNVSPFSRVPVAITFMLPEKFIYHLAFPLTPCASPSFEHPVTGFLARDSDPYDSVLGTLTFVTWPEAERLLTFAS